MCQGVKRLRNTSYLKPACSCLVKKAQALVMKPSKPVM